MPSVFDMQRMIRELKGIAPELTDAYSQSLNEVAFRIERGYRAINSLKSGSGHSKRRVSEKNTNDVSAENDDLESGYNGYYPHHLRFRGKGRYDSFTYTQGGFWFTEGKLHLSPIGDIRFFNRKKGTGLAKTCTVKRNSKGQWSATIVYETDVIGKGTFFLDRMYSPVGIDLGLRNIATLSDGRIYPNTRRFESLKKSISKIQRRMSVVKDMIKSIPTKNPDRKIEKLRKGYSSLSKKELQVEYTRLKRKFDNKFNRFRNVRKGEYNRISADIVGNHSAIAMEDIDVRKIIDKQTKKGMRTSFSGAAWSTFTNMIEHKAEYASVPVVFVDPYNTSRICSHCGNTKPNMSLDHRTYYCIECGHVCDRDVNAALNILMGSGLRTFQSYEEPEALPFQG